MRLFTVRWDAAMHEAFRELAYRRRSTMNQLAVYLLERAVREDPAALAVLEKRAGRAGAAGAKRPDAP